MAGVNKKQFPNYFPSTTLRLSQVRAKLLEMYGGSKDKPASRGLTPYLTKKMSRHSSQHTLVPTTRRLHRRIPSMPVLPQDLPQAISEWKQKYWNEKKSSRKVLKMTQQGKSERSPVTDHKKTKKGFLRPEAEACPQPPPNSDLISPLPSPHVLHGNDLSSLLSPICTTPEKQPEYLLFSCDTTIQNLLKSLSR